MTAILASAIRFVDDPRLETYSIGDAGCTGLVYGETGAGKTVSLRPLIEHLGAENVIVVATDPRMAPLDGLGARIIRAWMSPEIDEPMAMKMEAARCWQVLQEFHRDLRAAAQNDEIVMPKVLVHDNLMHTGEILERMTAPPGGRLSIPQWGEVQDRMLQMITFYRGLQIRGLLRIFNCTSGWEVSDKGGIVTDQYGNKIPKLFIGSGGRVAPRMIPSRVDYMFNVTAAHAPGGMGGIEAGPDGMVRRFQTCNADGIVAKGAPQLPTPFMKADWWEVYRLVFNISEP